MIRAKQEVNEQKVKGTRKLARRLIYAIAAVLLGCTAVRAQNSRPSSIVNSNLGRENLRRVAASAGEIKAVLLKDAGLMVELKRWVAKDATDHGQLVSDSDLTDEAIFERLASDAPFRSIATVLVQQYGYLLPKLNPERQPPAEAPSHESHKLLNRGLSQREAVLLLYLVTAGFAVLSLVLLHNAGLIALVLGVIGIGVWFGVKHLRYSEFSELQALVQRAKRRKESTANNIRIRRAAEALNSCADFQAIHSILKDALQPLGFDGFQLKIDLPDHQPESCLTLLPPDGNSSLQSYPDHPQTLDFAWELTLELIPAAGHTSGHFTLFRTSRGEPLLVDFDLLCSEFRIAVSNAVRQAMSRAEKSSKVVAHEDPPLAARAASTSSSD